MFTYTCPVCGESFTSVHSPTAKKRPTYCSHHCYSIARRKPIPQHACVYCGKTFSSKRKNARFCSMQCLGKNRRKDNPRFCKYCGVEFYVQPSHNDIYCSRECYDKDREPEPRYCQRCGKEIDRTKYGNVAFCSIECRDTRPLEGVIKPCLHCGENFYICTSHADATRFCSRECRLKYQGPTSIEEMLIDELDKRSIEYKFQYPLGVSRLVLDFAFPDHKLCVEADGVYWHSLPENIERDKNKDTILDELGWTVIHLDGDEIRRSPQGCVDRVLLALGISAKQYMLF